MALTSYTGTSGNFINLNIPQGYASAAFTVNTTIPAGAYQLTLPTGVANVTIGSKTFTSSGLVNIPTTATSATGEVTYIPTVWSTRASGMQTRQNTVAYGNGVFVVGGDFGRIGYSTDGLTWTSRASVMMGSTQVNVISFGNGIFMAGGQRDSGSNFPRIATSTDGLTWTSRSFNNGTPTDVRNFAYGADAWVGAFYTNAGAVNAAYTTDNGVNWNSISTGNLGLATGTFVNGLVYGDGLFVMAGSGGAMSSSSNILQWTTRTSGFGTTQIQFVGYGNNLFFAGGDNGVLTTSPDGVTWTARTSQFGTSTIKNGGYFNGYYYLVGSSGLISISTNGTNWTVKSSGLATATGIITDIAYGEGRYVLAQEGDQNVVVSSYTVPSDLTAQLEYKGVGATAV